MSEREEHFWQLAEQFIANANDSSADNEHSDIADAMLYAAARYNVYVAASGFEDRKLFKDNLDEVRDVLLEQFQLMLDANLEDYLENFKVYFRD